MAITYDANLNMGNEALQTGRSITVTPRLRNVEERHLVRHIHYENPLVPEDVIRGVLASFARVAVRLMAEGLTVHLRDHNRTMLRLRPDLQIHGGNINEERARRLDPAVKEITPADVSSLIRKAGGIDLRVHATAWPTLTQMLLDRNPEIELHSVRVKGRVERKK